MSRASSLVLSLLLLLATSSLGALPTNSVLILPGSEELWSMLDTQAKTLPQEYDSFIASLSDQIALLQTSNDSLTQTNQSLQDSNARLQTSNQSLTLRNEDLENSLRTSQGQVETLEKDSTRLQKALDDSMLSITRAESDAAQLRSQNTLWKVATAAGVLGTVAAVIWALVK